MGFNSGFKGLKPVGCCILYEVNVKIFYILLLDLTCIFYIDGRKKSIISRFISN